MKIEFVIEFCTVRMYIFFGFRVRRFMYYLNNFYNSFNLNILFVLLFLFNPIHWFYSHFCLSDHSFLLSFSFLSHFSYRSSLLSLSFFLFPPSISLLCFFLSLLPSIWALILYFEMSFSLRWKQSSASFPSNSACFLDNLIKSIWIIQSNCQDFGFSTSHLTQKKLS